MGTTRIKVIDLSSQEKEIKTSRKHAEKLAGVAKLRQKEKTKAGKEQKPATTVNTEKITENTVKSTVPDSTKTVQTVVARKTATAPSVVARRHLGKKYQEVVKLVDKSKSYPAKEALELLLRTSITHFDPTVEVHLNVADKNLKLSVTFPHPILQSKTSLGHRKELRYLIFSDSPSVPSKSSVPSVIAKNIIWGDQSTIADIESGKLKPGRDFDQVLAQPKFMPALAKIAKILGPRGLMPNPKAGTISQDPLKTISQKGDSAVNLALDPTAPILHTVIGKLSVKPQHLSENLKTLISAVGPQKIKKATITTTMGPGIRVDPTTLN